MTKSMTSGNPAKLLLLFAIPVIFGNMFQQLYSIVDTIIVGRALGVHALAAVGCTGSITFLVLGFGQICGRGRFWSSLWPDIFGILHVVAKKVGHLAIFKNKSGHGFGA